ncbi:MAG: class I SAM-dependent methyltransferase [Candidatus Bathyarchaeia archaeon]
MSKTSEKSCQEKNVKRIFNEMAGEYDHLLDLWYNYTFGNIDDVLKGEFRLNPSYGKKPIAIDVGCGTGIQSLRLASLGYRVVGIDIADVLVQMAKSKLVTAGYQDAEFSIADAQSLPFEDNIASCVNCCGPTLSFVPDWPKALSEIARCLQPNGKVLLEVEGKWNLDLFWEIVNALGHDFLGYDEKLSTALSHLLPPWNVGHTMNYSFKLETDESVIMPLKLFAPSELNKELRKVGLVEDKKWGLHVLTNLVPSTVLHRSNPSALLRFAFTALASVEKHVYASFPFNSLGNSILIVAHKMSSSGEERSE